MRQGAWGHRVVKSECRDWGASGAEQVLACPTHSPQNLPGSAVASGTQRTEVSEAIAS